MDELTPREEAVLRAFAEAEPSDTAHVAARLHISQYTVRSHMAHIEGKLGVTERTSAFRRKGWLVLP